MISISGPCNNLELQSIRSNSIPAHHIQAGALSEMSVEPQSITAPHREGGPVEESFVIPRTGQCLTCMAGSDVLIAVKPFRVFQLNVRVP